MQDNKDKLKVEYLKKYEQKGASHIDKTVNEEKVSEAWKRQAKGSTATSSATGTDTKRQRESGRRHRNSGRSRGVATVDSEETQNTAAGFVGLLQESEQALSQAASEAADVNSTALARLTVRLQPSCERDQQQQQTMLAALSSAASSSSVTTFTVVRVASESRPTTQMQFADRIVENLQEI